MEEIYVRDENNIVVAGIEVQKYLSKSAKYVDDTTINNFQSELKRLGFYTTDTLINGECGDNSMILDSYKDADIDIINPEILPAWFKETPMVLVDRDRVYKLENKYPKQLGGGY